MVCYALCEKSLQKTARSPYRVSFCTLYLSVMFPAIDSRQAALCGRALWMMMTDESVASWRHTGLWLVSNSRADFMRDTCNWAHAVCDPHAGPIFVRVSPQGILVSGVPRPKFVPYELPANTTVEPFAITFIIKEMPFAGEIWIDGASFGSPTIATNTFVAQWAGAGLIPMEPGHHDIFPIVTETFSTLFLPPADNPQTYEGPALCASPACDQCANRGCFRCGTKYCSRACQKQHWAVHRLSCAWN
jgi:hypothetical protein